MDNIEDIISNATVTDKLSLLAGKLLLIIFAVRDQVILMRLPRRKGKTFITPTPSAVSVFLQYVSRMGRMEFEEQDFSIASQQLVYLVAPH